MPKAGAILLTGTGKDFVGRVGESLIREAVVGVLCGENLRTQTEFLTRSRISQVSAALLTLYLRGKLEIPEFSYKVARYSAEQLRASRKNDNADVWPAQWFIGLTGKSVQNVLKGDHGVLDEYVSKYEETIGTAIAEATREYGPLAGTIALLKTGDQRGKVELDWRDLIQLSAAFGAQTLTIRGSDKSMYGKLFEKLILGSVLSILGYQRVSRPESLSKSGVFWLSDGTNIRESDATLLYGEGRLVRFDIGFIGPGNSEISKDKLSRFSTEENVLGRKHYTKTMIVVDRLPNTSKTINAAKQIGAEIVQMSMGFWPKNLAMVLSKTTGKKYQVMAKREGELRAYFEGEVSKLSMLDFLENVALENSENDDEP